MSLLQQIKQTQLQARKAKDAVTAASLTTLIGEAEMVGKNNGNREVTDAEVVAVLKKFIKNVEETWRLAAEHGNHTTAERLHDEKLLYSSFLPKQLSNGELKQVLVALTTELNANTLREMGKVMKVLKERYDGQYDGAAASTMIKGMLT